MVTVTKKEMVLILAEKTGVDKSVSRKLLQAFLDQITETLKQGNRLEFRHFGIFAPVLRHGRTGHNPKTHDAVRVLPHIGVRFRAGARLKRVLAGLPVPAKDED